MTAANGSNLERVLICTNEYPPNVYGGAGVHVEYLSRALSRLLPVEVRCFGEQQEQAGDLRVEGYGPWPDATKDTDPKFRGALDAFHRSLEMARDRVDADLIHCHTWYTDMAGLLGGTLWSVPYVLTIHSLEPLRPWKAEQLGNAYQLSSWMERTAIEQADAIIAVSKGTRQDVLDHFDVAPDRVHVIHNGIDLDQYQYDPNTAVLESYGIDPSRPFVLFVGRITWQKGIIHLVNAIPEIDPSLQVVLCAGAPDTPEIGKLMEERVAEVSRNRDGVFWIREMLPREQVIQFYSQATVFCCPSVYEPFGIINLEAMACQTPVVASAVGGIPEVVVPEETGLLVDVTVRDGTHEPLDPEGFAHGLAAGINRIALDPSLAERMGQAGRKRVEEHFSWDAIAERTLDLYREVVAKHRS